MLENNNIAFNIPHFVEIMIRDFISLSPHFPCKQCISHSFEEEVNFLRSWKRKIFNALLFSSDS